jgi:hypothetical protein
VLPGWRFSGHGLRLVDGLWCRLVAAEERHVDGFGNTTGCRLVKDAM